MEKVVDSSVEMDYKRLWSDLLMYIETIATCKQEKGEPIEHYLADCRCYSEVLTKMQEMQSNEYYAVCPSFVIGTKIEMCLDGEWVKGEVIDGYRYRDGIITMKSEDGYRMWCPEYLTDLYRLQKV